ncbi:hypothetical protein ACIBTV_00200 [Micromonospora sp. NPDC049366]|uniref:hypothetical protein n=1 Tax=Micromonospora sp. NPDC049366 TaxID=3364271 RepID=UPI00379A5BFC
MRPPRVLLLTSVAAGGFSVLATLFSEPRAALQAGLAASAAFLGYVLLVSARVASAGPSADGHAHPAPRVRRTLVAGLTLLALVMAVELRWLSGPVGVSDVFVPFYAPLHGGVTSSPGTPPVLLDLWRQSIMQGRIAAVGPLLATVCLAVVVLALPARRRPGRTLPAGIVAALLVVLAVADVWDSVGDAPLSGALAAGWPALPATLVAAEVLAVSGERGAPCTPPATT